MEDVRFNDRFSAGIYSESSDMERDVWLTVPKKAVLEHGASAR